MKSLADLKLQVFHILASEGSVHSAKDHVWHMETLAGICRADPELLLETPFQTVDLSQPADQQKGIAWWEELTAAGGEGMVVKPLEFVTKGRKGMGAACGESPGPRVSANHLWRRVHSAREPEPA